MPRPMGPRGKIPEKSKDFKGSMKRLFNNLNNFNYLLIFALALGMIRAILALIAPNKLSDLTPYESYQMGYDLVVAGKTYNKSSLGTATLVSTADYTIADNGVYFIDASAENLTINKASGSFTKLYVFGNSVSTKVPVKFAKELRYGTNGNVALKDLNIQQYSTNMFVHNNNGETATVVALD